MGYFEARQSVAAELIRMARRRAGLSQEALARASGIRQPLISRYESGQVQPTLPTLQRLIGAAGGRLTIELDGLRRLDTQRGTTEEESRGIDAAFIRMLEDVPPAVRRQHDAARRRWAETLRSGVVTDEPAFPSRGG
jgi:transcriptional regulator with XRE-family HTH domain